MPRLNRSEICSQVDVQLFHLINRCVRRTYLCGKDRRSGKDYSHRKQWIRDRLEELAGIFGLDVLGFAVLSNHLHVVARTRPDVVSSWTDDEIVRRWWRLFPQRRDELGRVVDPTESDLAMLQADATALKEKRRRLSDISWFMRCLVEPIARRRNKEDEVTGRFWEGRFRAQPLLDEAALAACMAYVDLDPIRAKVASTPEESDFTSVQARIEDLQSAAEVSSPDAQDVRTEQGPKAGWLAPIELEPPRKRVRDKTTTRRASNKGCLPMSLPAYLALIDWTGRVIHRGKRGQIPANCAPILERLQLNAETWLDFVMNFRRRLRNSAKLRPATLASRATRQKSSTLSS